MANSNLQVPVTDTLKSDTRPTPPTREAAEDAATRFVEEYQESGHEGVLCTHFLELATTLNDLKAASGPEEWRSHISHLRQHNIQDLLQQDPFTSRAYARPRRYAGDAVTIDMLYRISDIYHMPEVTSLGKAIWSYIESSGAVQAVRVRRMILAHYLDKYFRGYGCPYVLSVACGHIRELKLCQHYAPSKGKHLYALDHDALSLKEVALHHPELKANFLQMNALRIGRTTIELPPLDFIYSAGLYDYLDQETCRGLTQRLFQYLKPGGKLLLANFMPTNAMQGYMEVYMDWFLYHRTLAEILDVAALIPPAQLGGCRLFSDVYGVVGYLELTRA